MKSKPNIMVLTRWEAARCCHSYESVLTVFSPWWHCDWGHDDHLIVEFQDRYLDREGAPSLDQIEDILCWAYPRLGNSMLIHCKAGQSRSTAVSVAICAMAGMREDEAFDYVYSECRPADKVGVRPFIPNMRVLEGPGVDVWLPTAIGCEPMNEEYLSLEDYDLWRSITKHKQLEMAQGLLDNLRSLKLIPKTVDAMDLLDALGCAGLSLIIGEYASETFVKNLETTQVWPDLSTLLPNIGEVES